MILFDKKNYFCKENIASILLISYVVLVVISEMTEKATFPNIGDGIFDHVRKHHLIPIIVVSYIGLITGSIKSRYIFVIPAAIFPIKYWMNTTGLPAIDQRLFDLVAAEISATYIYLFLVYFSVASMLAILDLISEFHKEKRNINMPPSDSAGLLTNRPMHLVSCQVP